MSLLDKYVRKKSSANNLTVKQLVDFRTHIGTKFSFRNPLIDEYIYGLNISKNIIFNSSISLLNNHFNQAVYADKYALVADLKKELEWENDKISFYLSLF